MVVEAEGEMAVEVEAEEGAEEEEEEGVVEAVAFVTKAPPMKLSKPELSLMIVSLSWWFGQPCRIRCPISMQEFI